MWLYSQQACYKGKYKMKNNWPWFALALFAALMGAAYYYASPMLAAPLMGAPVWVWLVTLVALPLANEGIRLSKSTTAQSIYHLVIKAMLKPFGALPLIGDILRVFDAPAPAPAPQPTDPPQLTEIKGGKE
jgi:hypothetical protein